jgi:hypothetical protein
MNLLSERENFCFRESFKKIMPIFENIAKIGIFGFCKNVRKKFSTFLQKRKFFEIFAKAKNFCETKLQPGDVALSCNPSYWGARIVGWFEVESPPHCKPM